MSIKVQMLNEEQIQCEVEKIIQVMESTIDNIEVKVDDKKIELYDKTSNKNDSTVKDFNRYDSSTNQLEESKYAASELSDKDDGMGKGKPPTIVKKNPKSISSSV